MTSNLSLAENSAMELFTKGEYLAAKRILETGPYYGATCYEGAKLWNAVTVITRYQRISAAVEALSQDEIQRFSRRARRILGVFDLRTMPLSLGDVLIFNMVLMTIREIEQVDKIDVVWMIDPQYVARWDQGLSAENLWYYLKPFVPLIRINPHLGEFHIFDDPDSAEDFIVSRAPFSAVCPLYVTPEDERIDYYLKFIPFLYDYAKRNGQLPILTCRDDIRAAARRTLREHVANAGQYPIAIHLRKSGYWTDRNYSEAAWKALFLHARQTHPQVRFLLIGARFRGFPELEGLSNLLFTKDLGTGADDDMALIQESAAYMSGNAGPLVMAKFGVSPYRIVNHNAANMPQQKKGEASFPWARENQKLIWEKETEDILIREFEEMLAAIDLGDWARRLERSKETDEEILSRRSPQFGVMTDFGVG